LFSLFLQHLPEPEYRNNKLEHAENIAQLESLMDRYGTELLRLAFSYVKRREVAEDITQEVFIKCFEKLSSFRGESSYKTWLYRITINRCKDVLRTWAFKNLIFIDSPYKNQADISHGEAQFLQKEENQAVANAIFSLPVKYREVIILRYYEDLSLQGISDLLDMNPNTLKSRILRAHEILKKKLKEVDFNG
jgi:RNA polymerase sigma-70 factor (ECF subfamily)